MFEKQSTHQSSFTIEQFNFEKPCLYFLLFITVPIFLVCSFVQNMLGVYANKLACLDGCLTGPIATFCCISTIIQLSAFGDQPKLVLPLSVPITKSGTLRPRFFPSWCKLYLLKEVVVWFIGDGYALLSVSLSLSEELKPGTTSLGPTEDSGLGGNIFTLILADVCMQARKFPSIGLTS